MSLEARYGEFRRMKANETINKVLVMCLALCDLASPAMLVVDTRLIILNLSLLGARSSPDELLSIDWVCCSSMSVPAMPGFLRRVLTVLVSLRMLFWWFENDLQMPMFMKRMPMEGKRSVRNVSIVLSNM